MPKATEVDKRVAAHSRRAGRSNLETVVRRPLASLFNARRKHHFSEAFSAAAAADKKI